MPRSAQMLPLFHLNTAKSSLFCHFLRVSLFTESGPHKECVYHCKHPFAHSDNWFLHLDKPAGASRVYWSSFCSVLFNQPTSEADGRAKLDQQTVEIGQMQHPVIRQMLQGKCVWSLHLIHKAALGIFLLSGIGWQPLGCLISILKQQLSNWSKDIEELFLCLIVAECALLHKCLPQIV